MTDEELWDWLPHAVNGKVLPRCAPGHDYGRGCPIHGKYKGDARQTWGWNPDKPYKVRCATGDEWLPTNDYGAYARGGMKEKLDCQEKHVDDGRGCIAGGQRYWCAAAANFFLYSYIIQLRTDLVQCWKKSGSGIFLHKAMIVWASIAKDYPLMDYERQNVGMHPSWWLGKMTCWGEDDIKLADYFNDKDLWKAVEGDEQLGKFLASKGIAGDLKTLIFKHILLGLLDGCRRDLFLSQGIGGEKYQYIIERWDNDDPALGPTADALRKQADGALWRHFHNDIYRDGINTEVSLSYGLMGQNQAAEIIGARLKQGKPVPKTPRLRNVLCGSVRLIVIDQFLPNIGDAPFTEFTPGTGVGSAMTGALARGGKGTGEPPGLVLGYELFGDPVVGKWLHQSRGMGKTTESIGKLVAAEGDDIALGSRVLTGYGLGILESGERRHRRAATLAWCPGGVGSHAHSDMLSIELFAFGKTLAPDLGYPEDTGIPPKRVRWGAATISHSTVTVDRSSSGSVLGTLNSFKTFPGVHLLDVSAEKSVFGAGRPPERTYRRQLTLVDVGPDRFYVVDCFRVKGGSQHDWSFHANHKEKPWDEGKVKPDAKLPETADEAAGDEADELAEGGEGKEKPAETEKMPADFARRAPVQTQGIELSDPRKWKLLSDYQQSINSGFSGTEYLHYPQFATPGGQWAVTWDTGDGVNVRLTMLKGCAGQVILADGEPQYRPGAPKFVKYVLARNEGQDLKSNYVGVLEAYKEAPTVRSVTDLRTGDDDWSDVALRVETEGRTDYVLSSLSEKEHAYPPGIKFRGAQGFISEKDGNILAAHLVGFGQEKAPPAFLECSGLRIQLGGAVTGTVASIQPEAGTFETESELLHPGLVGEILVLGNDSHKCAYRVTGLEKGAAGRWSVTLEADFVVGISPLKEIKGRTAHLAERITTYLGRFAGMTLSNEDGSALWRIAGAGMTEVTVAEDGPELDEAEITDTDGDLERCLKVCDFGPGDRWFVPSSASLVAQDAGYVVRANMPVKVLLPKGRKLFVPQNDGSLLPAAPAGMEEAKDSYELRPPR
jgi:hypothetical protein